MNTTTRVRREPPLFRAVQVIAVEALSPRMQRVTLAGAALEGFVVGEPAASVRVLLPAGPGTALITPAWNGNEFLLPDGTRPVIRTFTPRRFDGRQLDIDVVIHDGGTASAWATRAAPGDGAAVSGPGRGYSIDTAATRYLLVGDESAMPAIGQLLETIPTSILIDVHIEVSHPEARLALPSHAQSTVTFHDLGTGRAPGATFVDIVRDTAIDVSTKVWVAGEAAAVQQVRGYLFSELGLSRTQATVRGYWKHGRAGDSDSE